MTRSSWPAAVAVSAVLDAALREPPARWHPVVWLGRYLSSVEHLAPPGPPVRAVATGAAAWCGGLVVTTVAAVVLDSAARRLPPLGRAVGLGVALWPLWSGRLLLDEVAGVGASLRVSIPSGQARLARIVSRDTATLDSGEVAAAAIESLAENLSDSVVAPLFWFALGGLPAAAAYRFVNTADARWGYRSPRWEHAGKAAARADDVANLMPSRITGGMLLVGAAPRSWRYWPDHARRTPSPNSGWPMAAMALRLDRRLAKPGVYVLHPDGAAPDAADLEQALRIARVVIAATVGLAVVASRSRAPGTRRARKAATDA